MLYLVDSSAQNSRGHNLEYLKRISAVTKSEFVILGNKKMTSHGDSKYDPTFEYGTWDFGRFGFRKKLSREQRVKTSKTLGSSKTLLITENIIEKLAELLMRVISRPILIVARFSRQSRCFYRDIANSLPLVDAESKVIISTVNAREAIGLYRWVKQTAPNKQSVTVILRRPILDLRSTLNTPFLLMDALLYLSAIRGLENKVRLFADTPGLAARISKRAGVDIENIGAMGFEPDLDHQRGPFNVAIAPNSRLETRYSLLDLKLFPDLDTKAKINLDTTRYRELLSSTKSIILPYDALRYRTRSSGVFAEALTLGILPIVPVGTSMSREIAELNSKILSPPELISNLKFGDHLDLTQFIDENLLITFQGRFIGSFVLEVSNSKEGVRKSIHDFHESGAMDSFIIYVEKQTFLTVKSGNLFRSLSESLNFSVYKIPDRLFGVSYLDGDLLKLLSIIGPVKFYNQDAMLIEKHSPKSICKSLGI